MAERLRFLPPIDSRGYYLLLGAVAILILGPLGGITAAYMNFSLGFFVGGQVLAGILGQVGDARVEAAYRRVIDACRRHGKHPGMGGVYDPPHMEKYVRMGMRFILCGSDLSLLMAAAKERAGFLRKAAGEA